MSDESSVGRGGWLRPLREPLVQFLIIGLAVFAVYDQVAPVRGRVADEREIGVDRDALLTFVQFRANAFEPELFEQGFDRLDGETRQNLVDEFVREEVLYREALALGLDRGDYIMRQRMVQKLEFLIEDLAETPEPPDRKALEAFYAEYRDDYLEPSVYTFAHVFFDAETRGREAARAAAVDTLQRLANDGAAFNDAVRYGDRPLYLRNYVERTRDYVVGHLGEALVAGLDAATPSDTRWIGPLESPFGWHLVLLTARRAARLPPLDEIEARVADDYARVELERAKAEAIDRLVAGYEIDDRLVADR